MTLIHFGISRIETKKVSSKFGKAYGYALIVGSFLGFVTMALHPVGGSLEHIYDIYHISIISHTIGLFSLPIITYGYIGVHKFLSRRLENAWYEGFGITAYCIGIVAAIIATTVNGLILPFFVKSQIDAGSSKDILLMIVKYNTTINYAFDLIFIVGLVMAILVWSILITRSMALPKWIGILGIILVAVAIIALISGVVLTDLSGFRMFMFGYVFWSVAVGISMIRNLKRST